MRADLHVEIPNDDDFRRKIDASPPEVVQELRHVLTLIAMGKRAGQRASGIFESLLHLTETFMRADGREADLWVMYEIIGDAVRLCDFSLTTYPSKPDGK